MKIRFAAAGAGLLALTAPGIASADDTPTYASVTHCAAYNKLLVRVYSYGDGAAKHKTEIATYNNQWDALAQIATIMSKKESKDVADDISAQENAMFQMLSDDGASSKLIADNNASCVSMGKDAYQALIDSKK